MKKISILLVLLSFSIRFFGQDHYKSLYNEEETAQILNEVKEFGVNNPEKRRSLNDLFEKINNETDVVQFHYYEIKNYDLLSADTDPSSNLEYFKSYYLLINKAKDTIDDFGIYSELFKEPILGHNDLDFTTKEFDESMYWILNFMEKTDWDKDKISIITIIDVPGFFILYKDMVYVPYRNRMVDFVTYFNQVEFFHYRFGDLIRGKKIHQQWSDTYKER